jgi:hypothetical protein
MRQVTDYLKLVTRLHAGQPNYNAMLSAVLQPFSDLQAFLNSLPVQFDIDQAIGAQLDIVGQWVGQSRNISIPLPNIFFSWDSPNLAKGWDRGIWKGPYSTVNGLTALDDDTYRLLLKTIVLANSWDGTIPSAQIILNNFFGAYPSTFVFIEDRAGISQPSNFFIWDSPNPLNGWDEGVWFQPSLAIQNQPANDPAMTIVVSGKIPSIVLLSILDQGLIEIKPEGVRSDVAVTSVDGEPVFGFDVNNRFIGGWDTGAWGVSPSVLENL